MSLELLERGFSRLSDYIGIGGSERAPLSVGGVVEGFQGFVFAFVAGWRYGGRGWEEEGGGSVGVTVGGIGVVVVRFGERFGLNGVVVLVLWRDLVCAAVGIVLRHVV